MSSSLLQSDYICWPPGPMVLAVLFVWKFGENPHYGAVRPPPPPQQLSQCLSENLANLRNKRINPCKYFLLNCFSSLVFSQLTQLTEQCFVLLVMLKVLLPNRNKKVYVDHLLTFIATRQDCIVTELHRATPDNQTPNSKLLFLSHLRTK